MKIGPAVRRLMPIGMERLAAQLYRRVFVDLDKVAAVLAAEIPQGARVLDIGGGDGELLNLLLRRRPDLHVTMVDVAPSVGKFVEPWAREKVAFHAATSLEEHVASSTERYGSVIVSDVMHHLPRSYREAFLRALAAASLPGAPIFIKDIEPGHPIATLSYLSDVYVSGDKGVSLISQSDLSRLATRTLPGYGAAEVGLLEACAPNYLIRLSPA